ncbi:MAG: glycosyltransferase [Candidatus Peribacteria bacterium]|nr:glycosyltransferase [Candidatus Peribacteria bacterium]
MEKTILSCLNVDLNEDEFEILVVDNCSIDNTVKVVKVLQKKIKNLRLVINYKNY